MRRHAVLVLLPILLLILFIGCSSDNDEATPVQTPTSATPATYIDVSPTEAKELIDTVANLVVLDVSPLYTQGHLPGAINHPMFDGSLAAAIPSLNKNVPYLVYCHSDSVSIAAVELLIDNGFETVYRLAGNYAAWVDAGYEIETGKEPTPSQIPTSSSPATYVDVSPAEAKDLINTMANLVILDVSPLYAQGHLPGAINHPMFDGSLEAAVPSLNKNVPYLVYCHSDSVSIAAAELLINNGFETVYRLAGNYAAWVDAGYDVEIGDEPTPMAGWIADGMISTEGEYSNTAKIGDDFELNWSTDSQYIYVGMKAKTDGWVAIGFEPSSKMKNADMVFGFVEDGQVTVVDMYSTGDFGPHPEDTQKGGTDNILEFGGSEDDEYTVIEFKRNLVSGDEYDNDLTGGTIKVIWAYGSSDSLSAPHSERGYSEIEF